MWIYQLTYETKHDIKHAHYVTYEDACEHVVDIITPRIPILFPEQEDKDKIQHYVEFEEWDDLLEMWCEYSEESITIEEYEVQGSGELAERRNVHAVLRQMAVAVLDENVTGITLQWAFSEKIVSTIIGTPQMSMESSTHQLVIPGVEEEPKKRYPRPPESAKKRTPRV